MSYISPNNTLAARILIVDDWEDTTLAVSQFLGATYRADIALSGPQALLKWNLARDEGDPYEAIVLDLAMPEMSGFQVAERIRETDDKVKIIFFSAYDDIENVQRANQYKASAMLIKTMPYVELRERVAEVLER